MRRYALRKILLALLAAICCSELAAQSPASKDSHVSVTPRNPQRLLAYGRLPLSFEANQGQADERVKFLSSGQGYTLFLTPSEALLALRRTQTKNESVEAEGIGIKLLGTNPRSEIAGAGELSGKVSYFIGNDPRKWLTGVPTYAKARYQQIYQGIDLVFYGNEQQLETDFVVAPGADPHQIRLQFEGGRTLRLSPGGDLILKTSQGEVRLLRPHVYQDVAGKRREVSGHYVLQAARTVSFSLGEFDRAAPLVIDPILVYSTALNGANFAAGNGGGHGIAVDVGGNAYVTGYTDRSNFLPTPGAFTTANGLLFVTKINPSGTGVVYTAVFGGTGSDVAMAVAVDAQEEPVIAGFTSSADFPTMNPIQATLPAGTHAFVTKLNAAGSGVLYSTLLGGSGATGVGNSADAANAVTTDANGALYLTGYTNSLDFPTKNAVEPACPDFQTNGYCNVQGFVTKLDPTQSGAASLLYSTYLGGKFPTAGQGIAVDASGNAYVAGSTNSADFVTTAGAFQPTLVGGSDAFVSVLNPSGSGFVYSTFLGYGQGWGIAVDGQGDAYVTGDTNAFGGSFPVTAGAFQTSLGGSITSNHAFVTKLNPSGSGLVYSTLLGGSGTENFNTGNIAIDANGNAYISGFTSSTDFPTTGNAIQATFGGPTYDAFVTELNASGSSLVYSTYLGGAGSEQAYGLAVDASSTIYVMGTTSSANFPTTPTAFEPNVNTGTGSVFVARIGAPPTHLAVNTPASATSGSPFSLTVTALDASNNQATSYTGTIHFTSSDGQAALPSDYTFTVADSGIHIFSGVTLSTPGNQTITATDTANAAVTGTSAPVNVVVPLTATHFSVAAPASATAGNAFSTTVTPLNAANQTSTGYTGTVVFTSTDPQAVLPTTYTFTAADNGTHVFSSVTLNTAGSQTITVTDTVSASITGNSGPISVSSPPPPVLQITDNEAITVTDTEAFPDVFDAEAVHVADAAFVTPLIAVTAPAAEFSAGGLGFGGQSGTQSITVSDIGQAPLTIASAAISGSSQFNITQISCSNGATSLSAQLSSGGMCILMISYTASATPANDNATLVFGDNAALSNLPSTPSGANYTQSIPLSGGGTNIAPPPPPPAVVLVSDNETIHVADGTSFEDVLDQEQIKVTDQVIVQVVASPTTTTISANAVIFGAAANAMVSVTSSGASVTGNVTLSVDGGAPSSMALSGGSATFNLGALSAGNHSLAALFAAQGPFSASNVTGTITVQQATPSIVWPQPAPITFGTPLSSTQLNATANITGVFAYTPPSGTALNVGNDILSVLFTPADAIDYTTATATVTLSVLPRLAITNPAATTFTEGASNSFTVTTSGLPTPTITETGPLPKGVTFADNANGTATLAGIPATGTVGSYPLSIVASDSLGVKAQQYFTLTINAPIVVPKAYSITSPNHTTFYQGSAGSFTITTKGLPAPTIVATPLPLGPGITLVDHGRGTATLSYDGNFGLSPGTYTFTITATGDGGAAFAAVQNFTLQVLARPKAPTFTSADQAVLTPGNSFTVAAGPLVTTITASGALPGVLPSGVLFFDQHNGTAILQAGSAGTFHLTFTASNPSLAGYQQTQQFTLLVQGSGRTVPQITSADHTTFYQGLQDSFTVTTTGFPVPSLTLTPPAIAPGVSFINHGNRTATLSYDGNLSLSPGTYTFIVAATGYGGAQFAATQTFTLEVLARPKTPTFTSADQAVLTPGDSFTVAAGPLVTTITASGGLPGALPSGVLFFDQHNGTAILQAGSAGAFHLTFTASNPSLAGYQQTQQFTLFVPGAGRSVPKITSPDHAEFWQGFQNSFTITTTGSPVPTLMITPPAVAPEISIFYKSGTATLVYNGESSFSSGTYTLTVTATGDGGPQFAAVQNFTIRVLAQPNAPSFTSANQAVFNVNSFNSFTVAAGPMVNSISESGPLPLGLSLIDNHDGTATLLGIPLSFVPRTGLVFNLRLTAGNSSVASYKQTQAFTLLVVP